MTISNFTPSYNDIHNACLDAARKIKSQNIQVDRVIGLTRGGLLPAVILSHLLDVPMTAVSYSSTVGNGDNKNHQNELPAIVEDSLLFVDDIIDSGYTMKEIVDHYKLAGKDCHSYALYFKTAASKVFVPTFASVTIPEHQHDWIVFPFETNDQTNV